jgi:hypothetical protein
MAYAIPLDQPLSETQAKFLAQIGTMKNLANFSFLNNFKIKKEDNISLFDYLIKILRAMGIDPQNILVACLNDLFTTEKIVEIILRGMAQMAAAAKVNLDTSSSFVMPPTGTNLTIVQKKQLTDINYNWLNYGLGGLIYFTLSSVVDIMRTVIVKEMMILIFGKPKKSEAAYGNDGLTYNLSRFNELIDEASCGGEAIFSVSTPSNNRNEDLEYNRIKKVEQIKNGNLSFKVTCQGVDITLPDYPTYLFKDATNGFISGTYNNISPQEAMLNVFNFTSNQIQKGTQGDTSQSNANSGTKSFTQNFLEVLTSSITCLLRPFFFGTKTTTIAGVNMTALSAQGISMLQDGLMMFIFQNDSSQSVNNTFLTSLDYYPYTSCEIFTKKLDKNSLSNNDKKKTTLITILCNVMLNMIISFILSYVLEKAKKLIKKYIAKRAQEKARRKVEKLKAKAEYSTAGKVQKNIERAAIQAASIAKIAPALQVSQNIAISNINII